MTTTEQPTKTEAPRPRAAQPFATYTFSGTGPLPEFNEERARLEAWAAEAIESAYNRKEVDFAQLRRAQRLREEIARRWPGPQRVDPDWIRMMETRPDPRTDPEAIKDLAGDLESMLNDQATGSRIDLGELVEHFHRRCSEMGLEPQSELCLLYTSMDRPAPCPWCGSADTHALSLNHGKRWFIACTARGCGSQGPTRETRAMALFAWSTVVPVDGTGISAAPPQRRIAHG